MIDFLRAILKTFLFRIEGTFIDEARHRLRRTQESEEFNTWLTMVSIVGKTGVGKSTVASLLSGNDTMFKADSTSSGTTTLGADISTIIPSYEYRAVLEPLLASGSLHHPDRSRPLFLIDSEGMAFRGDEVDFVTTGPVAIIANIIVWITSDRLRPSDILEDIRDYLKGLDRISIGTGTKDDEDYGEFIVVLNKMQDTSETDEELCNELLEYGSSEEDDQTRDDLYERFKDIACIGLPMIHLNDGEDFGYPVLTPRFKEGLFKISNRILLESETPRNVRVGTDTYEMNSTEAETIIGMLISAANEGNIDLTDPCNVLFSLNEEKVIQALSKMSEEFSESTQGKCSEDTQTCTPCVCDYKIFATDQTKKSLTEVVNDAIETATSLCGADVGNKIGDLIPEMIEPWYDTNICKLTRSNSRVSPDATEDNGICDISELQAVFDGAANTAVSRVCSHLFLCGSTTLANSELSLETQNIFLTPGAEFTMLAPPKGSNGSEVGVEDEQGEDGGDGEDGKNIELLSKTSF